MHASCDIFLSPRQLQPTSLPLHPLLSSLYLCTISGPNMCGLVRSSFFETDPKMYKPDDNNSYFAYLIPEVVPAHLFAYLLVHSLCARAKVHIRLSVQYIPL